MSIKTNKREKAFIKLLDYNEFFLETLSKIHLSHKTVQEIIRVLKTYVKLENGYSLKWQTNKDLIKKEYASIFPQENDKTIVDLAELTKGYAFAYQVVGYLFSKYGKIEFATRGSFRVFHEDK